jgi:hypothetical protein
LHVDGWWVKKSVTLRNVSMREVIGRGGGWESYLTSV